MYETEDDPYETGTFEYENAKQFAAHAGQQEKERERDKKLE